MVQLKYFGDNRDYFKYDLITSIFEAKLLKRYVFIPMLTGHRDDNEGNMTPKLTGDKSVRLYEFIKICHYKSLDHWETWLTPYVFSYKTIKPADQVFFRDESRDEYWNKFEPFMNKSKTLVFVDPDTGLQPERKCYFKKIKREKYILNYELNKLFYWLDPSAILMIYQHLQRNEHQRHDAIQKKLLQVKSVCNIRFTCAYREGDLAFIFLTRSRKMFEHLLYFLDTYYERSLHKYKNIVQLDRMPLLLSRMSMPCNSNAKQMRDRGIPLLEYNSYGVITNAEELSVGDVVHKRVLCPCCHTKVFEMWPEGWDSHAAFKCSGVIGENKEQRKAFFRKRFAHLFRS
jgi:hypothetical protein